MNSNHRRGRLASWRTGGLDFVLRAAGSRVEAEPEDWEETWFAAPAPAVESPHAAVEGISGADGLPERRRERKTLPYGASG